MRVVKFGGSSVADVPRLRSVAALVARLRAEAPVAVVVSAMAGVTDALLDVGQSAIAGESRLPDQLDALYLRHYEAWIALHGGVAGDFDQLWTQLAREAHTLARRSSGKDATTRAWLVAQFSGWGERLAVGLLAAALREAGLIAEAFDEAPITLEGLAELSAIPQPSALATRAQLLPRLASLVMRGGVPALPGYIARDAHGALTTLGRNGSDHSAAVIAAALGAERLTIYSDVPGMLTADPRMVADAALLPALTYDEAQRMAMLGAKALHPRTIEPVARWGIPLELRASYAPDAPGTDIIPSDGSVRGLARDATWIVAARPLADASDARSEVTALWLPAWPLRGNPTPERCAADALASISQLGIDLGAISHTVDTVSLVVEAAAADRVVQALHTALSDCGANVSDAREAALA